MQRKAAQIGAAGDQKLLWGKGGQKNWPIFFYLENLYGHNR